MAVTGGISFTDMGVPAREIRIGKSGHFLL
jgi:hypothetical protein